MQVNPNHTHSNCFFIFYFWNIGDLISRIFRSPCSLEAELYLGLAILLQNRYFDGLNPMRVTLDVAMVGLTLATQFGQHLKRGQFIKTQQMLSCIYTPQFN